jgi:chromosome segregation ATPase
MKHLRTVLWLAPCVLALPVAAAEWFKYENEDGVPVISHYIPPSLVHKGYTVVDDTGNVLRVVPRELTGAELAAKRAREAEEQKEAEALQTRKRKDEELMKLYASVEDVEAARDRKINSIETEIGRINADIERLRLQKSRTEAEAAERERRGEPTSPEILENIRVIQQQIEDRERDGQQRRVEMEQQRRNFQYDIERMRMLLGEAPPEPEAQPAGMKTAAASSGH